MTPENLRYRIPAGEHQLEQEVKRSRFIATVLPATSTQQAREAIAAIAARYPDATHNCWAFLAGVGPQAEMGSSDAGEPAGTAGRPMLAVLQGSGIGDIAAVVTRYFGGVKLGSGGLVRAYGGTLQKALNSLPTAEHVVRRHGQLTLEYAQYEQLKRLVAGHEGLVTGEQFGALVTLEIALPADCWQRFAAELQDYSHGSISLQASG